MNSLPPLSMLPRRAICSCTMLSSRATRRKRPSLPSCTSGSLRQKIVMHCLHSVPMYAGLANGAELGMPKTVSTMPEGWVPQNGAHVARNARIDNDCYISRGGYLRMESHLLPDSVDNTHGRMVKHATYACRTAPKDTDGHWCDFTENMRIEVRARRSSTVGINDALWFMGNNSRPWPDNGEIDLLENPKKEEIGRASCRERVFSSV